MKKSSISISFLIFILTSIFFIQFSVASESYVGVEEDDEFIWKIEIDEELADEIFEDSEVYGPVTSDDIWEENDDFASANLTTEGSYIGLNLTDDDWYKIQLNIDDEIWVYVSNSWYYGIDGRDFELYFYNNTGKLLDYSNLTETSTQWISYIANYTGLYYIQITNETLPQSMLYDMHIDIDEAPTPKPPPNPADIFAWLENIVEDYYDYEGLKFEINRIKDEDNHKVNERWVKGVILKCTVFKTLNIDDEDAWNEEHDYTDFLIVDSDERDYHRFLSLIIADDVDWDDVAEDLEKDFELNKYQFNLYLEIKDIEANDLDNGLEIKFEPLKDDFDDFEVTLEYDDNGVLEFAELTYGGVPVCTIELEKDLIEEAFESGIAWIIIGAIIAGGVAATITALYIRKRRLAKRK